MTQREAAEIVRSFIPLCSGIVVTSVKDDKQALLRDVANAIENEAIVSSPKREETDDLDLRPRYSMKRMRDEIAKAREQGRRDVLDAAQPILPAEAHERAIEAAAISGWNACRMQVYLLSEDYIERTHELKGTATVESNFYRGQYDVAKSFAKAFTAFEARDCDYFKQIDIAALSAKETSK